MVTQQELIQQREEQQRILNQSIPQRRLGSRVNRKVQTQVIQQKEQAQSNIQIIDSQQQELNKQREEQQRQEKIRIALRSGNIGGSGLNREDRQLVAGIIASTGRTAGELSAQRSKALEGGFSTIGGQEVIVNSQGKVTGTVVRDTKGNISIREPLPEGGISLQSGEQVIVNKNRSNISATSLTVSNASPKKDASISEKVQNRISELRSSGSKVEKFTAGGSQVVYSQAIFIRDLLTQPIKTISNTVNYLGSEARILITGEGIVFPEIAYTIRQEPEFSTGAYLANIAIQKVPEIIISSSDLIRTIGLTEIENSKIIAPEYFAGERYPTIKKGQTVNQLLEEFNTPVLEGEGSKASGFTASPNSFKANTQALAGSSELPGLYQAPRLSPAFLKLNGEGDKIIGLNPIGTLKPTALRVTPESIELIPGLNPATSKVGTIPVYRVKEFFNEAPKGKSYIPFIKTEKEAIIPFGTELKMINKRFFFTFEGRKIPIFEYEALSGLSNGKSLNTILDNKFISRYYSSNSKSLITPIDIYPRYYSSSIKNSSINIITLNNSYVSNFSKSSNYSNLYSSTSKPKSYNSLSLIIKSYSTYPDVSSISISYPKVIKPSRYPIVPINKYPKSVKNKYSNNNPRKKYTNLTEGYKTFIIKGGKKQYLPGVRTKGFALSIGEEEAVKTLRATFGVEKTGITVTGTKFNYLVNPNQFRSYKINAGKKITLMDTFIQKRGKRLSSASEVFAIQQARRNR